MKVKGGGGKLSCLALVGLLTSVVVTGKLWTKSKDSSDVDHSKSLRNMEKLADMMEETKSSAALSTTEYLELVFNVPRNYTVFVLFHNDPHICRSCPHTLEHFQKIARSYWRGFTSYDRHTSSRHLKFPVFFVSVTMYAGGSRKMKVDLDPSMPSLYVFTPSLSSKYNQFERAEEHVGFQEFGRYGTYEMLGWVQEKAGFFISIEKEDKAKSTPALTIIAMAFCGVFTLINLHYFGYLDLIREALAMFDYSYGISVVLLWLLSGQMYNYIRGTHFMGHWELKLISFVYPGQHYQYGTESIIIMLIYALMVHAFMSLIEARERQLKEHLSDAEVHSTVVFALGAFMVGYLTLQMLGNMKH